MAMDLEDAVLSAVQDWVLETEDGKAWLDSVVIKLLEQGPNVLDSDQMVLPFPEPGGVHVHQEGTVYCDVCDAQNGHVKETKNGKASGQSEEHHHGR